MTSKVPFYISILLLIVAGITLTVMRHQQYGVPWTPGETRQVWDEFFIEVETDLFTQSFSHTYQEELMLGLH